MQRVIVTLCSFSTIFASEMPPCCLPPTSRPGQPSSRQKLFRPPPPRCCRHSQHVANALSRGLDFPSVDWVVQFDCPESTATYIHRAGRTQTLPIIRCSNLAVFFASDRQTFIQFFTRAQALQGTTRRALLCSCWHRLKRRSLRCYPPLKFSKNELKTSM